MTIEQFHHVIINDVTVKCHTRAYLLVWKWVGSLLTVSVKKQKRGKGQDKYDRRLGPLPRFTRRVC